MTERREPEEASEVDPWDEPASLPEPGTGLVLLEDENEIRQLTASMDSAEEWDVVYPAQKIPLRPQEIESRKKHKEFLRVLSKTGSAVKASYSVKLSRRALYLAKQKFPDFARNWDIAMSIYHEFEVEENIRSRAIEGVREPVYYQGNIVGYNIKHDSGLTQFWVKNNMRDKYGDKSEVTVNGSITHGVMVLPVVATDDDTWQREAQEALANQKLIDITPTVVENTPATKKGVTIDR